MKTNENKEKVKYSNKSSKQLSFLKVDISVGIDQLKLHPIHSEIYEESTSDYLYESLNRTGGTPINPIVVVHDPNNPDMYLIVSGAKRYYTLLILGKQKFIKVILIKDEELNYSDLKTLIIDLNKQKTKTGRELLNEFRHYRDMYPDKRGVEGYNRYTLIGKEIGYTPEKIKSLIILEKFFKGDGECVIESVFDPEGINILNANKIKKVVEEFPEKFNSSDTYRKIINRAFDYNRLAFVVCISNIENEKEFNSGEKFLLGLMGIVEFENSIGKHKDTSVPKNHRSRKSFDQVITDEYKTENTQIFKGFNREVSLENKFNKKARCIAGLPPYGNKRSDLTGLPKDYNGEQYAHYLVSIYERWLPVLEEDGSIYVNIDDFMLQSGELACTLEYFVIGMKQIGLHLVERINWIKTNPILNASKSKKSVSSTEMIYRFVKNPSNYFSNVKESYVFKYYINGVLDKTTTTTIAPITKFMELLVGNYDYPPDPLKNHQFDGKIDDIGIWNTALSQNEINTLYNYRP